MYNPVDVCWFDSNMGGAPSLPGLTAGAAIGILDACLINGFNSQALTSLVVSGGVATATKNNHGFWDHTVVLISGATPADLNGKKRITLVNANSFTFEAVGIGDCTATGTILAKMAPVGWTKTTISTNFCYYTKPGVARGATTWAFQIDDRQSNDCALAGRAPDGTTFSGNGSYLTIYLIKGTSAANRGWSLYADDRSLYFWINPLLSANDPWRFAGFADLNGFAENNNNDCVLFGCYNTSGNNYLSNWDGDTITGTGCSLAPGVGAYRSSHRIVGVNLSGTGTSMIDGDSASTDGKYHCPQWEIWSSKYTEPRGILPGLFASLHDVDCVPHGTVLSNPCWIRTPQLRNHRIRWMRSVSSVVSSQVIDITGPWTINNHRYGGYRIRGTAKKQGVVGRFPLALIAKDSGQIIRKTLSAADGTYAFNNINYLDQGYIVAEFDGEIADPLNAAIADFVTPEAMP